jgi:hypothetical protein
MRLDTTASAGPFAHTSLNMSSGFKGGPCAMFPVGIPSAEFCASVRLNCRTLLVQSGKPNLHCSNVYPATSPVVLPLRLRLSRRVRDQLRWINRQSHLCVKL